MEYTSSADTLFSYGGELVAILFFVCIMSLLLIYRKKIQRKKILGRGVTVLLMLCAIGFIGMVVVAIEYTYDFWPESDRGEMLHAETDINLSPREVIFSASCRLECTRYFRFDATRAEIDTLVLEQGMQSLPYSQEYFRDFVRFRPGEAMTMYRQDNTLLYYDEEKARAYLMIIDG